MRRGSLETVIGALVVFVAIIFVVFASKLLIMEEKQGICSLLNSII